MAKLEKKRLTKAYVDGLTIPARGHYDAPDDLISRFRVRVYAATRTRPRGSKVFYVGYRPPGGRLVNEQNKCLGRYGEITVDQARRAAEAVRGDIAHGVDPKADLRAQQREAEAERTAPTLEAIAREYIERVAKREKQNRAWKEQLRTFEHDILPTLGKRPIAEIKRSEIVALLERIADRGSSGQANEALKQLRACMSWFALRDDDFVSPIVKGMRSRATQKRDRVLTDDEIRIMWKALDACPSPFRQLVRFLTVTALRKGEAANARRGELKGDRLVIPAEKYKTKLEHIAPLSAFARSQLDELGPANPVKAMRYVFTTNGHDAPQGFGKWKAQLDREMERLMREAAGVPYDQKETLLKPWRLHDLRRTARTIMSRVGVPREHAERVLGHVIAGVEGVYDHHDYVPEKRNALERLAAEVQFIVVPGLRDAVRSLDAALTRRETVAEQVRRIIESRDSKVIPLRRA